MTSNVDGVAILDIIVCVLKCSYEDLCFVFVDSSRAPSQIVWTVIRLIGPVSVINVFMFLIEYGRSSVIIKHIKV